MRLPGRGRRGTGRPALRWRMRGLRVEGPRALARPVRGDVGSAMGPRGLGLGVYECRGAGAPASGGRTINHYFILIERDSRGGAYGTRPECGNSTTGSAWPNALVA